MNFAFIGKLTNVRQRRLPASPLTGTSHIFASCAGQFRVKDLGVSPLFYSTGMDQFDHKFEASTNRWRSQTAQLGQIMSSEVTSGSSRIAITAPLTRLSTTCDSNLLSPSRKSGTQAAKVASENPIPDKPLTS